MGNESELLTTQIHSPKLQVELGCCQHTNCMDLIMCKAHKRCERFNNKRKLNFASELIHFRRKCFIETTNAGASIFLPLKYLQSQGK